MNTVTPEPQSALQALLRRTGKPPILGARLFPIGTRVRAGGMVWLSNRYIDTKRAWWQRADDTRVGKSRGR